MPPPTWATYRVGARLPSLDSLISPDAQDQIDRLQRALSSVAYLPMGSVTTTGTDDARFVGRLLLGLLCRGWPTFSSPDVEGALLESLDPSLGLTPESVAGSGAGAGAIGWRLDSDSAAPPGTWDDALRGAFLRGDRRLVIDDVVIGDLKDSDEEEDFYEEHLEPMLGHAIGWLEWQRPMASMLREDLPGKDKIGDGRVDFAIELPGIKGPIRRVIELDGHQHLAATQHTIDAHRDRFLANHGWQINRVPLPLPNIHLHYLQQSLTAITKKNPFPFTDLSWDQEALIEPKNREAVRLLLTPHAVARLQLALSQGLMDGTLDLIAPTWTIAVVEREVPCAEIAVQDWLRALHHLCQLYDVRLGVEQIHLLVSADHLASFPSPKWIAETDSTLSLLTERLAVGDDLRQIDLGLDVSVGAHPTRRYPSDPLSRPGLDVVHRVKLRTAQRQSGYHVEAWPQPRPIEDPLQHQRSLDYFLQAIFRKEGFREGQLPIIERVLQRKDVIGLLPTGAGKSICFQLPALLSPGLSLVIDPIKSLMQDQVENLEAAGVMDAIQINSDTGLSERPKIEWQFSQGEYRLVFISPERLQIKNFRDLLTATAGKRPIAYVVIDEAHCVSEWGHDFRTAYLNLGRIVTEFCGRDGIRPPLVALTGTASEGVLLDVRRELEIEDEEAIIRPADFARNELKFEIVRTNAEGKPHELARLIRSVIPSKLDRDLDSLTSDACGGIVFCPHVNGGLGTFDVANSVSRVIRQFRSQGGSACDAELELVSHYSGDPPRRLNITDTDWALRKKETQRAFKDGRVRLLMATSAFGMGIDKPNIRYTIHYAMADSVEAFAQEAGRAGRDRADAVCAVLFTDAVDPGRTTRTRPLPDCLELGISVEEARAWSEPLEPNHGQSQPLNLAKESASNSIGGRQPRLECSRLAW